MATRPRRGPFDQGASDSLPSVIGMDADLLDVRCAIDEVEQQITNRPILSIRCHECAAALGVPRKVLD
jgi:hypothetical protein